MNNKGEDARDLGLLVVCKTRLFLTRLRIHESDAQMVSSMVFGCQLRAIGAEQITQSNTSKPNYFAVFHLAAGASGY